VLRWTALAAGLALLIWRVRDIGLASVLAGFAALGPAGFALVLGCSLLRFAARAGAWTVLIGSEASYPRALAATIAGDAAGNLTPLGVFVSEPTKAAYITTPALRTSRALAALAAENFFYSVSVALYVVVSAFAMLEAFDVSAPVRSVGYGALGAMAVVLAGAGWLAWRQPSVLSAVFARLPIARARALVERVREFELSSYGSVGGHTSRLLSVFAIHAFFHAMSFVEMWLTIRFLTGASHPVAALVLDGFGRIANVAFKMIPLQLGVHQYGSEVVALAVGLSRDVGLTSSLVRTARVLVWAAAGLGLLGTRRFGANARS
jgi:hypothetical protein